MGSQSAKCHVLPTRPPSEDVRQHAGIDSELATTRPELHTFTSHNAVSWGLQATDPRRVADFAGNPGSPQPSGLLQRPHAWCQKFGAWRCRGSLRFASAEISCVSSGVDWVILALGLGIFER